MRRPRIRGLTERFESRLLPLFKRRTEAVGALLPTLYLHGLADGDFDLALRGLLGERAPLSASSIARLKAELAGRVRAVEEPVAGRTRARVSLGRRRLRQGGAREGQGRDARRPGRTPERAEDRPGRGERVPRVHRELLAPFWAGLSVGLSGLSNWPASGGARAGAPVGGTVPGPRAVIAGRVFTLLILIGAIVIIVRLSDLKDFVGVGFIVLLLYRTEVPSRLGERREG